MGEKIGDLRKLIEGIIEKCGVDSKEALEISIQLDLLVYKEQLKIFNSYKNSIPYEIK